MTESHPKDSSHEVEDDHYLALLERFPYLAYTPEAHGFSLILETTRRAEVERAVALRLKETGKPPEWAKTGIIAEDEYLIWLRDAVTFPNGSTGTYIRLVEKPIGIPGVAVLPLSGNQVMLIRHFRHATGTWHWEIPRGYISPHETIEDAAIRELHEETGAVPNVVKVLGDCHCNSGLLYGAVRLMAAWIEDFGIPEAAEGIGEIRMVTSIALDEMFARGEITDAFTLSATALVRSRGWW